MQYYFYGFANQDDSSLIQWFIGDVDILREYLNNKDVGFSLSLRWEECTNGPDDTKFNAYFLDSLPETFIIAHSKRFPPLHLDLFSKILTSGHSRS